MKVTEPKTAKELMQLLSELDSEAHKNAISILSKKRLLKATVENKENLYEDVRDFLFNTVIKIVSEFEPKLMSYEEESKDPDTLVYWIEVAYKNSPNEVDLMNHDLDNSI